uniref:Uncharacterized protein n=1 Tax=Leersia perrieri TaxID=77586 RepID=A0A0D9VP66_9ORYZ
MVESKAKIVFTKSDQAHEYNDSTKESTSASPKVPPKDQAKAQEKPQVKADPKAQVKPQAKAQAKPSPKAKGKPPPKAQATSSPKAQAKPSSESQVKASPKAQSKAHSKAPPTPPKDKTTKTHMPHSQFRASYVILKDNLGRVVAKFVGTKNERTASIWVPKSLISCVKAYSFEGSCDLNSGSSNVLVRGLAGRPPAAPLVVPAPGAASRHVHLLGRPLSHLLAVPLLLRASLRRRRTPRRHRRRICSTDDLRRRCRSPTTPEAPPTTTQALSRGFVTVSSWIWRCNPSSTVSLLIHLLYFVWLSMLVM